MAQEAPVPTRRTCGTMAVHYRLLRTDPRYAAARAASEDHARAFAAQRAMAQRSGVTRIPVVVHVVYNTAAQNISDAQIQSQIDVLKHDFRKTNADVSSAPAAFAPLAEDARIEFVLASQDPAGAATTGITRTQTTHAAFTDNDDVKAAATGGADAWPADKYLNIWVCPLDSGGLLGYAQFPGGPAATDGVVILHSAFGTTGTAAAPFNLGRSATHEIGHWLNLRHIWGDDGTGCNGSDFVNDTPNAAGPNYGTPAFPHVTCNNGPDGDIFMDYMDYTDDVAMYMFTQGQVTRMQACLDSDRSSIGTAVVGPTLKFADDPITLKFRDDHITLKFWDDPITLKFRDDPITLKFRDDPITLKFRDDGGTIKFADDPITLKFRDDGGTIKFADDAVSKPPVTDLGMPMQPGGQPAPFILSTGHHSMAWTRSFPAAAEAAMAQYEEQIAQAEALLAEYERGDGAGQLTPQEVAEGNQLFDEYQRLSEEYRKLRGG